MALPTLRPSAADSESFGGVSYRIEGELVPSLTVELSAVPVYFEHHILLWKDVQVEVGVRPMQGGLKRLVAGLPLILTETRGQGRIAFSRDAPGHVFAMHLKLGEGLDVREHQWLAATAAVDYGFSRVKGAANMLFGGTGFFIDTFTSVGQEGILWLHGYGNVFEVVLQPGEQIDIEPGGWIYKDRSVKIETVLQKFSTGFFASSGQLVFNRFTGPGRVGIQSMYYHLESGE